MKLLKSTAMFLAAAITLTTLTSCSGGEVKQVEDKPFTVDGMKGSYTGDWKGSRPNGNGELIISDDEYYRGEWNKGALFGQGEIRKVLDDGSWEYYKGECAKNTPAGKGQKIIGSNNNSSKIEIDGDFSDESTLMYYATDDTGKLVDIGSIRKDEYVSFVGNPDFEGIPFEDWVRMDTANGFVFASMKCDGKYIGQTDENGVPNGYGYSTSDDGYHKYYYKLGTWKDGQIEGDYTEWKYDNGQWSTRIGSMKDGVDVGEYTLYTEYPDYCTVEKNNYDTSYTYTLCSDGKYRTGYTTRETYYNDGGCFYQKYLTLKNNPDDWEYYYEGEYAECDKDGNLIECGKADTRSSCSLRWVSYEQAYKDELWEKLAPVVAVGIFAVGSYALWSSANSASDKWLADWRERNAKGELEFKKLTLRDIANREASKGYSSEAEELRKLADSL